MDIKLNPHVETVAKAATGPARPREAAGRTDDVVLDQSRALETRLSDSPDIRADVVERAKALVADSHYPPAETIQKIANLLAINFETTE